MKNICVMFGAGAEAVFGIATGVNFAASVLGIEAITMNSAIKEALIYSAGDSDSW